MKNLRARIQLLRSRTWSGPEIFDSVILSVMIFGCGAYGIVALTVVPPPPEAAGMMSVVFGGALGLIAVFLVIKKVLGHLPLWTLDILNDASAVLVTLWIIGNEDRSAAAGLLYFSCVLMVAFFLPWRRMLFHLAFAMTAFAIASFVVNGHVTVDWFPIMLTMVIGSILVNVLQRRVHSLAAVVRSADDAIVTFDLVGNILTWNQASTRLFGYTSAEMVGRPFSVLTAGEPVLSERSSDRFESILIDRNRNAIDVSITVSQIHDPIGWQIGGSAIIRDIRDRKRLETELRHSQKLEAVGRLAAGLAHELNTPMQFVSDNLHFLMDSTRSLLEFDRVNPPAVGDSGISVVPDLDYLRQEIPAAITDALEGTARVTKIVQAMKFFGNADGAEARISDLNAAVSNTIVVAGSELENVAEVMTEFGELPPVICYESEINQVVLSLLLNAVHAVEDAHGKYGRRGTITVKTWQEESKAIIAVADTGPGIPFDIQQKIFDPFFTTKEVGRGSGQGLSVARSVVVDLHGGELTYETEQGKGTTFFIKLPIAS